MLPFVIGTATYCQEKLLSSSRLLPGFEASAMSNMRTWKVFPTNALWTVLGKNIYHYIPRSFPQVWQICFFLRLEVCCSLLSCESFDIHESFSQGTRGLAPPQASLDPPRGDLSGALRFMSLLRVCLSL